MINGSAWHASNQAMGETFDSITGHSAKAPVVSQIRQQLSSYAPTLDKDSGDDSDQPRAQNKDKHVHPNLFTSMVVSELIKE